MANSIVSSLKKILVRLGLYGKGEQHLTERFSRPLLGILALALLTSIALPLINTTILYPAYTRLLITTMETGATRLASHIIPPSTRYTELTYQTLDSPQFMAHIYRLEKDLGLLKIKIYSPDGVTIYSTTPVDIAKVATKPYFTDRVAQGEVYSTLTSKTKELTNRKTVKIYTVETTVPIMDGDSFLGAFELYFDISRVMGTIDRFNAYATYGSITACVCLVILAFILLNRESIRIKAMKQAQKLKTDVDQITSHDLKSPLVGALNGINFLERYTDTDDEQKEMLADMRTSVNTGLDLINRSLDIYKMESGRYQYAPQPVDILAMARRVVADISGMAVDKNITLKVVRDNGADISQEMIEVSAEETLCYSLIANLVKNAVEASENDQEVTLSLKENGNVSIAIHNTGVVPESIRDTFFDKYVTAHKQGGTGLGTYSAQLMTRTMDGTISMDSSEEDGTTITVTLPRHTP